MATWSTLSAYTDPLPGDSNRVHLPPSRSIGQWVGPGWSVRLIDDFEESGQARQYSTASRRMGELGA